MKIDILQKGGDKNHEIIDKATRYFASKLMSTRMMNTLNIRIKIRATELKKGDMGLITTKANGSKASKDFEIVIQRDMSLKDQLETIAHEMVHCWQQCQGTLQSRVWKSDNKLHTRWNGEEMGLSNAIPYLERPWEKEAFYLEKPLLNAFREYHHQRDTQEVEEIVKRSIRAVINNREKEKALTM